MAQSSYHQRRTRYRGGKRRAPGLNAFLAEMVTKYNLQDTPIVLSAVGNPSNTIDLPSTPAVIGPFMLRGVPPTELRTFFDQLADDAKSIWLRVGTNDICTVHHSARDATTNKALTFADAAVSVANDTITLPGHGLTTGAGPIPLTNTGGALPAGLAAQSYFAIVVDANTIKLATTLANALGGTAVDITAAAGGGVHKLTLSGIRGIQIAAWALTFDFVDGDVTAGSDTIAETGHGMLTGHGPVTLTTTGVLPDGLALATPYWIIRVDDDSFKLATSRALALAGTAVDITAAAGGGTHTLNRPISLYRALSSKNAIMRWMSQGVKKATMQAGLAANADTIFV